ncbi:MAG: hypothetical protein ISS66_17595 [Desulfobacteraceae bacterium]|nr:hypothetical protein [Desulfobacteraceae bacterium]
MQQMGSSDDHSLKVVLWITGIGCLTAVPFIFLPWSVIKAMASFFGHDPIPDVPVLIYFTKVLCGAGGFIGIFFIILARNPLGYGPMLYLGAYGLIVLGLLELVLGIIIDVSPIVYIGDVSFALILGIIILAFSLKLTR